MRLIFFNMGSLFYLYWFGEHKGLQDMKKDLHIMKVFVYKMVGMTGFEPATPWSQTKCSTKLSHIPLLNGVPDRS